MPALLSPSPDIGASRPLILPMPRTPRRSVIMPGRMSYLSRAEGTLYTPGTYAVWTWTWGGSSQLHVLGRKRDGEGFPLTACGMIAHVITDSERIVHSHLYGDEALEAAALGAHPVCPECYALSPALNPHLRLPRDIGRLN